MPRDGRTKCNDMHKYHLAMGEFGEVGLLGFLVTVYKALVTYHSLFQNAFIAFQSRYYGLRLKDGTNV